MCGLAGLFDLRGRRAVDPRHLAGMAERMLHRGPDGGGEFSAPGIGLAHRRLAIRDLEGGTQPMTNEDGRVVVVYNGELYGYGDTAQDLIRRGHRFRTRCDTEMIVHAWEEWGTEALHHFNGMFAIALWDGRTDTLFLARDRLGEKPLYYTVTPDGFLAFASELPALLAALGETPPLDPQAVEDYFAFGYVPDPKSIYRGIRKLPPGHWLKITGRDGHLPEPRCYWDVPLGRASVAADPYRELAERLDQAVRIRMASDVPLGAFLSGGVDSSAVVAFMAQAASRPVRTFSIGFGDPRFDESGYAAQVAERYRTDHTVLKVEADAARLVDRLARAYGEPFADPSAVPTFLVCEMARRHVTVALSGDGSDEILGGYRRHAFHLREEAVKAMVPAWMRRHLLGSLAALWPRGDRLPRPLRAKATLEALSTDAMGGLFRAMTLLPPAERRLLFSGDFQRSLDGYGSVEVLRTLAARAGRTDALSRALYVETKLLLPGGMLTKVDRASMANSLEVRAPFLDHTLVEWAAGLPSALKVEGSLGKAVLKRAMEPYLPRDVLYRPKQGFSPPVADWLRGSLHGRLEAAIEGRRLAGTGLFDPDGLRRMLRSHRNGTADHARPLWALLMFDAFLDQAAAEVAPLPAMPPRRIAVGM